MPSPRVFASLFSHICLMAGLLLASVPHQALAAELVTVKAGTESTGNVHPLNVRFVEEQLARANAIQSRLLVLKQRQAGLPKQLEQLNNRVRKMAEANGANNDAELAGLRAEAARLRGLVDTSEKALAAQKPESFSRYDQFVALDRMTAEADRLRQQVKQADGKITARLRAIASRDPLGEKLAEEALAMTIELALVTRERGNVQVMRDNIKREVGGLLNQMQPQGAPNERAADVQAPMPPPADAAERMARFRNRNSPDEVRRLGERFFAQIELSYPGLEEVAGLVRRSEYQAALDAYKRFFFRNASTPLAAADDDVAADVEMEEEGLDADAGGEDGFAWQKLSGSPSVRPPHPKAIDVAMRGDIQAQLKVADRKLGVVAARLGPPGGINWAFAAHAPKDTPPILRAAYEELAQRHAGAGRLGGILLNSYVVNGNREHLTRWVEYTDDWSMNWSRDIDEAGLIRNYNMLIGYSHIEIIGRLRGSAALNPKFIDDLPSTTLARVLLASNAEYLSSAIRLMRSGQYNFRIMMLTAMLPHVMGLQEFHSVRWTAREATRLAELSMTHNIRRDGANATLANAGHENTDGAFLALVNVMTKADPDWLSPWWADEFTLNLATYTRYWIHLMKQDGRAYRISTSPLEGHYGPGGSIKVQLLRGEPEVQARLWKVYRQAFPYDDPEVATRFWTAFMKAEPTPEPQIRSEGMAFAGYNFLRTGWNTSDFFLYFHFPNTPVASGRDDHNGFMLLGNGHGYLLAPPVTVDNRIQYLGHDLPPWSGGKGTFSVPAKPDAVSTMRFHSSDAFDMTEGLYEGPYVLNRNRSHPDSQFAVISGVQVHVFGERVSA